MEFERRKDTVIAHLGGELDHCSARQVRLELDHLIEDRAVKRLVLDMRGMTFMDSSGIALIVRLSRRMTELGGRLWLENPARQPGRVLEASGIDRLVPVAVTKL